MLSALFLAGGVVLSPSGSAAETAAAASGDAGPALSQQAAAAFARKLIELSNPSSSSSPKSYSPIVFTDTEVNSYLKYDRPPFLPPSVTHLVIHFKPEGIRGGANVNFDKLQPAQQSGSELGNKIIASIFNGDQRVTALAKIASQNGTAKLQIQDVHVGSIALSDWLVNWLLQNYVESQYKVDLSKAFLLPGDVTRIDFAPGKAIFVRSPEKNSN